MANGQQFGVPYPQMPLVHGSPTFDTAPKPSVSPVPPPRREVRQVDSQWLIDRLDALESKIAQIQPSVDFGPILDRINSLKPAPEVDLNPIIHILLGMEDKFVSVTQYKNVLVQLSRIEALVMDRPKPEVQTVIHTPSVTVDLSVITSKLEPLAIWSAFWWGGWQWFKGLFSRSN